MAVTVTWQDTRDAQRVVDALLTAAAVAAEEGHQVLANRYADQAYDTAQAVRAITPPYRARG